MFSLFLTPLACGDETPDDAAQKGEDAQGEAIAPSGGAGAGLDILLPPEIKGMDFAAILAAWQGDHVIQNQGKHEAWNVKGNELTSFQNGKERTSQLDFFGPCKAGATESSDTGRSTNFVGFSIVDGQIIQNPSAGNPPAIQQGNKIVACDGSDLVYFDGSSCTFFAKKKHEQGTYSFEAGQSAECEVKVKGEWGEFFFFKTASMSRPGESKLYRSLNDIPEDQRADLVHEKYDSFDEAKAALK